jgi:TolA-binding protein
MSTPPFARYFLLAATLLLLAGRAHAQAGPDQAAAMLLASGKRAYNEKNYPFAAGRFREFLQRHGGHRDAHAARYGLALCLLDGPQRDYDRALEQLQPLAGARSLPEYPFVLYYTGLARRGQGVAALALAKSRPNEANNHRNTARQRFGEAARSFADAASAFFERGKNKAAEKGLPADLEWSARSRCDQAEMLLRLRQAQQARAAVAPFTSDKRWQQSRYLALATYYHGFASFLLGERFAAGKALSRTSVLGDEVFGTHARYLLGRVYHLNTKQNEREEARTQYQAVLKDHEQAKKQAQEKLRQPTDDETRARLEQLVRGPAPDHVARAAFFLGVLQYEDGRFAEALEYFRTFAAQHPTAALAPEARLRQGFCEVQLRQFDAALRTLQGLADKHPLLADQALLWTAKAQAGKADPLKPETYRAALDTFRQAADRANQRAGADPRAKKRRGQILAELAEAQQHARLYREAAATCNTVLNDRLLPDREDELLINLATALQLAGDYAESDRVCARFRAKYAASTLAPALEFRCAENASFLALAAAKLPNPAERARETARHNDEAVKRYTALLGRYPEFAHAGLARQGLAMAHARKGDMEKAREVLEAIPAADRSGPLAVVSYQLADTLLRLAPAHADDAVAAGKLEEKLRGAADLLEAYLGGQGQVPRAADALLKLGYCHQRLGRLLAKPAEQQQAFAAARTAYERLLQRHPRDPAAAYATFERAKVLVLQRDPGGAVNELRRFASDPLKKSPVAPMALLHLATVLRGQNRLAEAAAVLADCRKQHEDALARDPARSPWLVLLRYHHAVALHEAGKLDDARALFEQVAQSAPGRPASADAALRAGQCRKELAEKQLAEGRALLARPGQRPAAEKRLADAAVALRAAAAYLTGQEQQLRNHKPASEEAGKALVQVRSRMLYEAAWALRAVAKVETDEARRRLQLERWEKLRAAAAGRVGPGQNPPPVALPEVALSDVPLQAAESQVRNQYAALIKEFPDLAVSADARFELAELLAGRGAHDEAVKHLQAALEAEREPSAELADRIRVRLGACLLDRGARKLLSGKPALAAAGKKDVEAALEQLQPVAANAKSPLLAQATYREAECQLQLGRVDEAIKLLTKFRDHGPFQNLPGLTDRALLRLGHALGEKKQWDASRQAYETLVGRFGASPWRHEARYGIGWAQQNLARYDDAVNAYAQVVSAVATRLAARAQLNTGLCRHAQKRYAEATTALLVVPFTYDYPDLAALALLEAARSMADGKQPAQAVSLLRRIVRDHPGTPPAEAAKKRLADLGEG